MTIQQIQKHKMSVQLLKDWRKTRPHIYPAVLNFNFQPATYLHSSRRSQFFDNLMPDRVWESTRVSEKISNHILKELDLVEHCFLDYPDKRWPLILLPTNRLQRLAFHIGAAVLGPHIRNSLAREKVIFWKEKLGQEVYEFVLGSARLLPIQLKNTEKIKSNDALSLGYALIVKSLDSAPKALRERVLLKMPIDQKSQNEISPSADQIVYSVMSIVEAEWRSLFQNLEVKNNLTAEIK
jgi:hypothetical protein